MANIVYIYILIVFLCSSIQAQGVGIETKRTKNIDDQLIPPNDDDKNVAHKPDNDIPTIHIKNDQATAEHVKDDQKQEKIELDKKDKITSSNSLDKNVNTPKILANTSNTKTNSNMGAESGAVMRGIFVFVGITMLFIMYIAFKTYRRRNKKNVLIKKYGVRTRRTDLEMEPLPLDEDEEDETVFDLGSVNNR